MATSMHTSRASLLQQPGRTRSPQMHAKAAALGLHTPLVPKLGSTVRNAQLWRTASTLPSLKLQQLSAPSPLAARRHRGVHTPQAAPSNANSLNSLDVERSNPLVEALENAKAKQAEALQVREALEAEAQEVAQLAVEAAEKKDQAKVQVFATVAAIEEATRQQQLWMDKVTATREQVEALSAATSDSATPAEQAALRDAQAELAGAEAQVHAIGRSMASLRAEMEALYAQAVLAEAAALKAEEVAGAAMTAAETAVKEEMHAAAIVKETQKALEKTLKAIKSIKDADTPAAAAAALAAGGEGYAAAAAVLGAGAAAGAAKALPGGVAMESVDMDKAKSDAAIAASAAAGAAMAAATGGAAASLSSMSSIDLADAAHHAAGTTAAKKKSGAGWVKWAALAVGAALATWFVGNTDQGRALAEAASGLAAELSHKLPHIHIHESEKGLVETIVLLFTSIVCVPLVVKGVPGGNPVLGYLLGGALVGPYAFGLVSDVNSIKHLAEMGVVLLLFNIGLELSLERLQSMAKFVFGMGTAQVLLSVLGVAGVMMAAAGLPGTTAVILGGALAMSSTAVAIQVLEERGEMGSRHGRATFSVLLLQDLAVVVLLMLIPLLAPNPDGTSGGMAKIATALGLAAVKAVAAIVGIIAGGRLIVRPLYKKISEFANAEIFAATTLLMVLGTSFLTQLAGLSLALGAFLAGLLIAETEYALQVESDIAPYKGLLMGLFFMSVGMEISGQLFLAKWQQVLLAIVVLIIGKVAVMAAVGPLFGLSRLAATRAGLLLAPGGEFAFVAFGEAVANNILPRALSNELILVVALSMALTPYLAMLGEVMGTTFGKNDAKLLKPKEEEMNEMKDHVLILGYGRVGQLISQMLSEQLIPFVALDVNNDAVAAGRKKDYPVYFGDAGSPAVLHLVGADRAACAVIALDTPGANYRAVWAMAKHYPNVKLYVRAHDIKHGVNLEKAGATAVVPETLEPSLQLVAAVLAEFDYKGEEVSTIVDDFRRKHLTELKALSAATGTTLGYGLSPTTPAGGSTKVAAAAAAASSAAAATVQRSSASSSSSPPDGGMSSFTPATA